MKTWIKRTLFGLLGVGIVIGGVSACGHRAERHGMYMDGEHQSRLTGRMVEHVSDDLNLDAAQKQYLQALAERIREQRLALIGTATDPRATIASLVAGPQFDRVKAQALIDEKALAVRTGSPAVIAATADFFDSLNPAQQQKLREHMGKRRRWFGHG